MTNPELEEIKCKIAEIKPSLATMEWDLSRNQLNPGKKSYYESIKKEYTDLLSKLNALEKNKLNALEKNKLNDLENNKLNELENESNK